MPRKYEGAVAIPPPMDEDVSPLLPICRSHGVWRAAGFQGDGGWWTGCRTERGRSRGSLAGESGERDPRASVIAGLNGCTAGFLGEELTAAVQGIQVQDALKAVQVGDSGSVVSSTRAGVEPGHADQLDRLRGPRPTVSPSVRTAGLKLRRTPRAVR